MAQMKNEQETKRMMEELEEIEFFEDKQLFMDKLLELWETHPDYRFGQLMKHILGELGGNLFFVPDGIFYSEMQRFVDTGFKGVDRKKPNRIGMNDNDSISVRASLEKE